MLVANMSTSWVATLSGICALSVAANSDERIWPERISTRRSSTAGAVLALKLSPLRSITRLLTAWPSRPLLSVAGSGCSSPSSEVRAITRLPARNCITVRARVSDLMKAVASSSSTPRRLSRVARVSPLRTFSSLT